MKQLYLNNIAANLAGLGIVMVLNYFTPLNIFKDLRTLFVLGGFWLSYLFIFSAILALILLLQYSMLAPIHKAAVLLKNDMQLPAELEKKAKRRTLNLPFLIVAIDLAAWVVMPAIVTSAFYIFLDVSLKICLFVFFRTVMIGLVASGLSFFLAEDFSRKELIPLFFPNGRLAAHPGTIKIPLLRRIGVLYGAGTLNPMIILVGTMLFCAWEVSESQVPAGNLLKDLFIFTLVLCIIFVFLALCLNRLVQRSIRKPLEEILGAIEKVKNGDFSHPMRVISNDEIGVLGDAGNAMIQGLVERERIRDTFGKYVGVEIRDQILAGRIPWKGERRMATLLFSDLRGFTPYVEANAPEQVIESMRAYFTEMEAAISGNDGLILQYVGDGIEAVFGIHEEDGLHARNAVAAAMEMRQRLVRLNAERGKAGMPAFAHGIGVHTGMVLAGNTGSRNRLSYTLIGETVNLAARIEQLTKELHCDILISQQTADGLDASVLVCKESPRHVMGCSRPLVLYRIHSVVPSIDR